MDVFDELLETHPHLKEFLPFLAKLNQESERGQVLISTGFLEQQLAQILEAFFLETKQVQGFIDGGYAPLGSLSSRITACYVLGLISEDEHHDLELIRKIRNDFAHNIHTSFETESIKSRCHLLKHRAMVGKSLDPPLPVVGHFTSAVTSIILHLVNRPHYVSKERCKYKNWKY